MNDKTTPPQISCENCRHVATCKLIQNLEIDLVRFFGLTEISLKIMKAVSAIFAKYCKVYDRKDKVDTP